MNARAKSTLQAQAVRSSREARMSSVVANSNSNLNASTSSFAAAAAVSENLNLNSNSRPIAGSTSSSVRNSICEEGVDEEAVSLFSLVLDFFRLVGFY